MPWWWTIHGIGNAIPKPSPVIKMTDPEDEEVPRRFRYRGDNWDHHDVYWDQHRDNIETRFAVCGKEKMAWLQCFEVRKLNPKELAGENLDKEWYKDKFSFCCNAESHGWYSCMKREWDRTEQIRKIKSSVGWRPRIRDESQWYY
eukprot:TRINITY_DN68167_c8_g1_i1.p1 TRINITY_DN68167_c8_g1~~TRINITY_DN68167_c8_g1_i1.p1  ORF type:complete len:145 (-),score=0.92 TRINITY_DN68167_c8_g1_i1:279-713(-)